MSVFRSPAWDAVTYWSLDLETGGLDAARDPILAVGMVPVRGGVVRAGEAWSTLVHPSVPMGEASLRIHHILPGEVAQAPVLDDVLPEIERRLGEGVLLAHHASFDVAFLRAAFAAARRRWPAPPVVDTVKLLQRYARTRGHGAEREPLPLDLERARSHFGLPPHESHDALGDALATAELFLVLVHKLGRPRLRGLL